MIEGSRSSFESLKHISIFSSSRTEAAAGSVGIHWQGHRVMPDRRANHLNRSEYRALSELPKSVSGSSRLMAFQFLKGHARSKLSLKVQF
jgi:hypothetical protein